MSSRLFSRTSAYTRRKAGQSAARIAVARDTAKTFITTAHRAVLALGVAAICMLAAMFVKPDFADRMKAMSPFHVDATTAAAPEAISATQAPPAPAPVEVRAAVESKGSDNTRQQQWVTAWLSKRYRVAAEATDMLVSAAYMTAKEIKLDPLLILSVMAIESGLNPFAESPVGAQGLMQVMSKVHHDKFAELGGIKAALNPVANIRVGSLILKDYVRRGGSVEAGLKLYVGAGTGDTDYGYGAKVLAEYQRLKDVAVGKKVPIYTTTTASSAPPKPKMLDMQEIKPETATESVANDKKEKVEVPPNVASL